MHSPVNINSQTPKIPTEMLDYPMLTNKTHRYMNVAQQRVGTGKREKVRKKLIVGQGERSSSCTSKEKEE
jgi:hypothetical protein